MSDSASLFCPNLTARVCSDLGPEGLCYWIKHRGSQTSKSHTECSEKQCFANDNRSGRTSMRHVETSCRCICIGPEMLDIARIIAAGMIPVIAVEESGDESRLIVEVFRPEIAFTVISHAIGDCFGNPLENKLPTCQVKSIQNIVSDLSQFKDIGLKYHWFWIDTLCVPIQDLLEPTTRLAVTSSMKAISQRATQTLVIDSDISLLTSNSETKEIFIRIAYSSWSSRLWTLQEAVYAQKLFFHFSDRSIDLDTLLAKYANDPLSWELAWHARLPYKNLRQYLDNSDGYRAGSEDHRALLVKALEGRRTRNRSDESLVIMNLLGINQDVTEVRKELFEFLRVSGFGGDMSDKL